jgi:pimeloyl-[acyl-carrier protein] methyl ester esterase
MNARLREIYVESSGDGPPLVLLHGFAMHGGLFTPLLPALTPHYRVHVVDLPGHGWSAPIVDADVATLAGALDDATAASGHELTVLGWSLGGQVALQWARTRPQRIRRLMLIATTPSFVVRDDWTCAMTAETLARFGDELRVAYRLTLLRFLTLQVRGSEEGRRTLALLRMRLFERGEPAPATLDAALALLITTDLRNALAEIEARTLVVAGDRDTLVPLAATRALAAALPDATHATIAGASHAPFLSHPRPFIEALHAFADG